jgi:histone H3/H4
MPSSKLAQEKSSKNIQRASSGVDDDKISAKKTKRAKPGVKSKETVKGWASGTEKRPMSFQTFSRMTREITKQVVFDHFRSELQGKVKFQKKFMKNLLQIVCRTVILDVRVAWGLVGHAKRRTLMLSDWEMTQRVKSLFDE